MQEILAYAVPIWIFNMSYSFVPLLKRKFPALSRFDKSFSERLIGVQGTLTFPIVLLSPLILLPFFAQSYVILLLKSASVATGDMLGSFIKRRLGFPKGKYLPGVDHGDYMILCGIVFVSFGLVSFSIAFQALIITYMVHPIVCYIGWRLGIKREPL